MKRIVTTSFLLTVLLALPHAVWSQDRMPYNMMIYSVPGGKPATVYRYEMTDDLMPLEDKKDDINHYFELTAAERWGDAHAEMFQPDSVASFVRYCKREAPVA